jgi:hypothetical protein
LFNEKESYLNYRNFIAWPNNKDIFLITCFEASTVEKASSNVGAKVMVKTT